jgi:hypothetical protein
MWRRQISSAGRKYPYLWFTLFLFLLTTIGLFSSRAHSLYLAEPNEIAEIKSDAVLPENSVYGPLARSARFSNFPPSPGKSTPKDNLISLEPSFSWTGWSESQWWIPADQELALEPNGLSESYYRASNGKLPFPDLVPRLQNRDIDPEVIMSNFITMGVADLLDDLSEQEIEGVAEQETSNVNPFEKALKEAIEEEGKENSGEAEGKPLDESAESESANSEETNSVDEAAGGGSAPGDCSLLFIGSFYGRPLATAIGTVQPDLLYQSLNNTVFIELEGEGEQRLDMDVVLRDHDNQESVAFGDLNNDGFIDMVVNNKTTYRSHVFKSDGQGNYETAGEIFGGIDPSAAVISDFNSDGLSDIAVGLEIDKKIVVDGKGFRRLLLLPSSRVFEEFDSMMPHDFDGDGLMDLLLSNYLDFTATIYLNRGAGMFARSDSFALQSFPYLQSRVDLDGDGIEDDVWIQSIGENISVVMMNGKNGIISNLGNMTLDPSLHFVLGDFNMDGIVDIALAHRK